MFAHWVLQRGEPGRQSLQRCATPLAIAAPMRRCRHLGQCRSHSNVGRQKTPGRFSVSPEGFPATYKLIRRLASASCASPSGQARRGRRRRAEVRKCGWDWRFRNCRCSKLGCVDCISLSYCGRALCTHERFAR